MTKQLPEITIASRISQIVIDGENFGYIITVSKAHNGYDECYHIEWGDTLSGPEFEEYYATAALALLRAAAIVECIKTDAWFTGDLSEFVVLGNRFLESAVSTATWDESAKEASIYSRDRV